MIPKNELDTLLGLTLKQLSKKTPYVATRIDGENRAFTMQLRSPDTVYVHLEQGKVVKAYRK